MFKFTLGPAALIVLLAASPLAAASLPVQVELFENPPKGNEFKLEGRQPVESYREPAFAFVRIPAKYSPNALPLDRSTPYVLRATFERTLAGGEYQFRLRARGAASFSIDEAEIARTKPQTPNTSGDDPVPPPPSTEKSMVRAAPYPHQDAVVQKRLTGGVHRFTLVAIVGGKGLMPTPGELAVSYGVPGTVESLLGPDGSPRLLDDEWETYVAQAQTRHADDDRQRRRVSSADVVAAWNQRHEAVRQWLAQTPAVPIPPASGSLPVYNDVDRFIDAKLEKAGVRPSPLTSDLDFLRRVSLDATGLIPTAEEIRAYLADSAKTRRANAIDRLVASPGWADHWVSYWQDVLAENPGILKPDLNNTGPFRWWLYQSFTDGVPFDRMVTELVEMDGSKTLGGPAGFAQATLNDSPMAAKADILAQAFLGQKLGCARCHDAPFHPFKQKDLFSMGALLSGKALTLPATSTVPVRPGGRRPAVTISLKAGESIAPEWPFQNLIQHADTGSFPNHASVPTRDGLAELMIAPQNERFAQVAVNRIWKYYMGDGIVEPVDDWSRAEPSHPELLQFLAREFVAGGYDMKHIARLIFSSNAYQRQPVAVAVGTDAKARLFAGPARRKMTAEELVDSLHLSAGKRFLCEPMNLNPSGDRPATQFLDMGTPERTWQMTALSNERDRPALALPMAQSLIDMMTTFGWRQSRQNATTVRDDAPSPMQTLILANGNLATRLIRLSDESAFTGLALQDVPLPKLVEETYLRVFSRPPEQRERQVLVDLLGPVYANRKVSGVVGSSARMKSDNRVSWSNHLSSEATLIRMEEERNQRMGEEPTHRLTKDFRMRYEDVLWAMVNSPEFVLVP
ncbi:MAG: DUF1549 and DUF1553 domain-containing protein [Acidobacteriota bacterium]|nr:DUF1549 and DUF1553 domain-containing protein [Acidobacteriota bacterium]